MLRWAAKRLACNLGFQVGRPQSPGWSRWPSLLQGASFCAGAGADLAPLQLPVLPLICMGRGLELLSS